MTYNVICVIIHTIVFVFAQPLISAAIEFQRQSDNNLVKETTVQESSESTTIPTSAPEWSPWMEQLPPGITEPQYLIESKTAWRSRKKETMTSTAPSMPGWELYDTETTWGEYGPWSNYLTEAYVSSESREVQEKIQYCAQEIITKETYSDWSGWSDWQFEAVQANDLTKVESRTVYLYCYFVCPSCGAHWHGWGETLGMCPKWGGGCGRAIIPESSYSIVWGTIPQNQMPWQDWHGTGHTYAYYDNELVFRNIFEPDRSEQQYRFRTRTLEKTIAYGEPTPWQDVPLYDAPTQKVTTRKVYRYRDRQQITIYYFYRWSEYGEWKDSPIMETDTVDVKRGTLYRYKLNVKG